MVEAGVMPDAGKLIVAAAERRSQRREPLSSAAEEDRIVRRKVFLYVEAGADGADPEGAVETCPYPYHLCEPCAEDRSDAYEHVERLYPQPVESACAECGAHSFRPWIEGYDDAFTVEPVSLPILPAEERRRRQYGEAPSGSVMYEAILYPMIVSDGPGEEGYRVYDETALIAWANRRFADWEIVAGRRRGFERHGVAGSPPSEADLIEMHRRKELQA